MKQLQRFSAFSMALVIPCVFATCSDSPESDNSPEASGPEAHHEEGIVELSPEAFARARIRSAAVEERVLETQLETTGSVDFDQNRLAHVSPRIAGRVESVPAELGAEVRVGEVLVRIDSIELGKRRAEFLQAKAQEDLARANFEREKGLFADRISSEQEKLAAQAAYRQAQAALRTAEQTLRLYGMTQQEIDSLHYDDPNASIYSVRAAFSGKVIERHATVGEMVTPENSLFLLADLSRLWIWIDVYELDLSRVHLGDNVRVRVDAYPRDTFRGEVSYLSDQVDPDTRTVRARIEVVNPGGKLRPGMFARIQVSDPHKPDGAIETEKTCVVPENGVQRDGEEFIVFIPIGENRFERRMVQIGRKGSGFVEILDGLTVGEEVVVEGAFLLKSEASKEKLGGGHDH